MGDQASDQLEPWLDLRGKVVMVTGASSGLGLDFCLDLVNAGCHVIAAARRLERINSLCDQINHVLSSPQSSSSSSSENRSKSAVRAVAVELDVCADGPTIEKSVQKAWEAFGRIDALVNNAGIRGFSLYNFILFSLKIRVLTLFWILGICIFRMLNF